MSPSLLNSVSGSQPFPDAIEAEREIGAYEWLWQREGASFASLAEKFAQHPGALPSAFVDDDVSRATGRIVIEKLRDRLRTPFDIRVHGEADYPLKLRDATHPVELFYLQGRCDLIDMPSVAVIGTRNPSPQGLKRARHLTRLLVEDEYVVVSGLAAGIDTAAHETAIAENGQTIAVIGTPLGRFYPRSNRKLQEKIAADYLLISQIPVQRYEEQDYRTNRFFFPERNKMMSALTDASIIVEAGETSGVLTLARAALEQGRKLFILENCFRNPNLTWPARLEARGAIRVREYDDIRLQPVGTD